MFVQGDVSSEAKELPHDDRRRQGLRVGGVARQGSDASSHRTFLLQQSGKILSCIVYNIGTFYHSFCETIYSWEMYRMNPQSINNLL